MVEIDRSLTRSSNLTHSNTDSLQRSLDTYILKLEKERRKGAILDQSIKHLQAEIKAKRGNSATGNSLRKLMHQIETMERKLQLMTIDTGEMQSYNRLIRSKIDNYRREQQSYQILISQISYEVQSQSKKADSLTQIHTHVSRLDALQRRKLSILRSKSANDRSEYAQKVQDMSFEIQKDAENKGNYLKQVEESIQVALRRPVDHVDVLPVQKPLIEKWQGKMRQKRLELEGYIYHVQELGAAMKQIQNATGISSIAEIVTSLIKSEDQHYELYTLINTLTSEIDLIEEGLKRDFRLISSLKTNASAGESVARRMFQDLETQVQTLRGKVEIQRGRTQAVQDALLTAQTPIQVIFSLVSDAANTLGIPTKLTSQTISISNLPFFLGTAEECLDRIRASQDSLHWSIGRLSPKHFLGGRLTLPKSRVPEVHLTDEETEDAKSPMKESAFRAKAQLFFATMA